ncbi:glycosyltransferase family 4 protein [bacterium]|nr:glycosyltransferase family 4 protein [bacterium]
MSQATRGDLIRILMIGPEPPPIGGTTVLFRSLVEALGDRSGIAVTVVNTVGVRGSGAAGLLRLLRLAWSVFWGMRGADVAALHVSTSGLHVIGPPVALAVRLRSTPLVVRKFGGTDFFEYSPVRRCLILWTLRRADLYLAETRDLVERARSAGLTNAAWYANSRPMPELPAERSDGSGCKRFVFLGQVHGGKGVRELVEAGERLPEGVTVDIYGPLGFDVQESELGGRERVTYRGSVDSDDVHALLLKYDALVLPSYHHGEGYPGVILEAYAAGLPVVSTRWRAIPELVEDGVTGLLVEPRDSGALHGAMLSLVEEPGLYARLREGVRERRREFSDEIWSQRFVEYCRGLEE